MPLYHFHFHKIPGGTVRRGWSAQPIRSLYSDRPRAPRKSRPATRLGPAHAGPSGQDFSAQTSGRRRRDGGFGSVYV